MDKMIYVVEDNDDIRELVEYIIECEGLQVKSFANATTFKQHIQNSLPDLFVLDIMLPDGNGVEICAGLKQSQATQHIPVLLMSANTNITYQGKENDADDFISKPFDIDDLVARVKRLLQLSVLS
ncbi:MAG: response regulator [Pedobacter sp.]|nr:response regulator [Pedobacter sp.]MDQ8053300.1 response regulator [Pedobacter sp.]